MTITANVGQAVIDVLASDTVVLNPLAPSLREGIQGASVHNTTAGALDVTIYESPDLTSASGVVIAKYVTIAADSSVSVDEILSQGYEVGQNLIAVASGVGLNIKITKTVTS